MKPGGALGVVGSTLLRHVREPQLLEGIGPRQHWIFFTPAQGSLIPECPSKMVTEMNGSAIADIAPYRY